MNKVTVKGRYIGGAIFSPKELDGKQQYNCCLVLEKGEAAKVRAIVDAAIAEKWGNKKPAGLQDWSIRVGDDPEYASYEQEYINPKASPKSQPAVLVKRDGIPAKTSQEEGIVYPGCFVAASVHAYAYDGDKAKSIKPGVTLSLRGVMFWKDGEPLSDRLNAEAEFADIESEFDEADEMFG